jgi:ribA/ribD-fused uncharacterized protein
VSEEIPVNKILFYRQNDPYGEFSNFSPHPFRLNGKTWQTSEHYFQAQKFAGTEHEDVVQNAKTASMAAKLGRQRSFPLRSDWEEVKEDVMRQALSAKFEQHPKLKALLLSTGDAELIEHTRNDSYWADGGDGTGKNRLGHLLMELRSQLRTSPAND